MNARQDGPAAAWNDSMPLAYGLIVLAAVVLGYLIGTPEDQS